MKNPTAIEVDAAVRSVLAELGRGRERVAGATTSAAEVFAGRLFSMRHAEDLPASSRELRIAPGTVVTPLARDFLKARGVVVRVVSDREIHRVRDEGTWGFAIAADNGAASALRRALLDDRGGWVELVADEAAAWVAAAQDRGAVLVTPDAALAVWDAHQFRAVRAAAVCDAEAAERAARTLGASLLVIEPTHQSIYALRQICLSFRREGAPMPPAGLFRGSDFHADRGGDRAGDALAYAPELARRPLPGRPADAPRSPRFGFVGAR